jgi:hypothetical protein
MLKFIKAEPLTPEQHIQQVNERAYAYFQQFLGKDEAEKIWKSGLKIENPQERALFYAKSVVHVEETLRGYQSNQLHDYAQYKWRPVEIEEFICSPRYLNKAAEIYPGVLTAAKELNNGTYVEAIMTGGIGSGKTTLALYTNAYQLYLLSCLRNPHGQFGLDPSSEILLVFQSMTLNLAKGVDYQRFRHMIEGSPYFNKYYPFDRSLHSRLVFPN